MTRQIFTDVLLAVLRAGIIVCVITIAGCAPTLTHGIPNLVQIEPGLYRGGEPTAVGWAYLRAQGVRTVVQLDYDNERPSGVAPPASMLLKRFSMPPNDGDDLFRGPSVELLIMAADALAPGVFVHCRHGQDRTGAVVATYRRVHDHWTKKAALAEALRLGFHIELFGLLHAWEAVP